MIEAGKEYYLVSEGYAFSPMSKVKVERIDPEDYVYVSLTIKHDENIKTTYYNYVNEYDLLSADEIIKVWHHHRMIVDSFERHG